MSRIEKNPGRVKAMTDRWYSVEWSEWRESFLQWQRTKKLTKEHKQKISIAKKGKPTSHQTLEFRETASVKKGGIMDKVYPLFQRGFFSEDLVRIGFERRAVTNSLAKMRKSGLLKNPSKEDKNEAIKRAHRKRKYTQSEIYSSVFARKLVDANLIPKDLRYWTELQELFNKNGVNLPSSPIDVLRLEIFLRAVVEAKNGDSSLLDSYYLFGKEIDQGWFSNSLVTEQEFVADNKMCLLSSRALEIFKYYHVESLEEIYKKEDRDYPTKKEEQRFLEVFYAVRVSMKERSQAKPKEGQIVPEITMAEINRFYDKHDPTIFDRLRDEIFVIRDKTTIFSAPKVSENTASRLERSAIIFESDPEIPHRLFKDLQRDSLI